MVTKHFRFQWNKLVAVHVPVLVSVCVYVCMYISIQRVSPAPTRSNPNHCIIVSDNMLPVVLSTQSHQRTLGTLIFYISIFQAIFVSYTSISEKFSCSHLLLISFNTELYWHRYISNVSKKQLKVLTFPTLISSMQLKGNTWKHWYPRVRKGRLNKIGTIQPLTLTEKQITSPNSYLLCLFNQQQIAFQRKLLSRHELVMDILHLILNSQRITAVGDYHLHCLRN